MKAVLMSINPRWCELIASGKKTVEVRKTKPKLDVPFKVYIYCTKGKPTFTQSAFCGKVMGEFVCDSIHEVGWYLTPDYPDWNDGYDEESCLTDRETYEYSKGGTFYQWNISNLVIYDKPRELRRFCKPCNKPKGTYCSVWLDHTENRCEAITRPPQSWCYCGGKRWNLTESRL